METFKLKIQEIKTVEKEISLPSYRKNDCHAYKIYSEDKCIQILHGSTLDKTIQTAHAGLAFNSSDTVECTEEEFTTLYNETLEALNSIALK
jgi:hypothetical protein